MDKSGCLAKTQVLAK